MRYELICFCEIDKEAVKSYCAIHNADESKNLGDIETVYAKDIEPLILWSEALRVRISA